jgi:phage terminase large subunit
MFWFDNVKCAQGVKALSQYRRAWDDKAKMFKDYPLHDWTSHAADAFRYGAVADGRRPANGFNRQLSYKKLAAA